jgi:hypothetical protein
MDGSGQAGRDANPAKLGTCAGFIPSAVGGEDRGNLGSSVRLSRWETFTLLNLDTAAGRPTFVALFHGAHSAFSFRADPKSGPADHYTNTRRWPFLNDSASLGSRFLNDIIVRKCGRNEESCQSSTDKNCTHGESPFDVLLVRESNLFDGHLFRQPSDQRLRRTPPARRAY